MKTSPIRRAINEYLYYMEAEAQKDPKTVTLHRQSLEIFLMLCPIKSIVEINKENVSKFKVEMNMYKTVRGGHYAVRSKNSHLCALRSFLIYLQRERELDVYSPFKVTYYKEDDRRIKFLEPEEIKRLFAVIDTKTFNGKRDKALLMLFFYTGMRITELWMLNRDAIKPSRELVIRGKNNKVRVVFLTKECYLALKAYLDVRIDDRSPLFLGNSPINRLKALEEDFRLSRCTMAQILKKHAKRAGIVSNPTPHTLRHSFATNLMRNGADIRSVQELLGHASIATTQYYTHVTNKSLKDVHERYSVII